MERYEVDQNKLEEVKRLVRQWNANIDGQQVEDFIDADWPEGEQHQEWLNEATPEEIADWVIAGQ